MSITDLSVCFHSLLSELRSVLGSLTLSDWFNRPGIIEVGDNFDSLTRGHATQPEELTDINFDKQVRKTSRGTLSLSYD